ncbi:Benzoate 4-monooxygenase [Termitomyces sp. T112]|nr:Benzoate 4-monooxygenase [Termitomyces sp. T112]
MLSLLFANPSTLAVVAVVAPLLVVAVHLVPYLSDPHNARALPGPWLARFSDLWLGLVSKAGHRSETIHKLHLKHGPFVRIAPNHVSIAHPEALQVVYAHGNGALKSDFYDAFVSIRRGIFNTRDRNEHTRKRKFVAHIFSQKSVVEFEPHIRLHIAALVNQWDRLFNLAVKGEKGTEGGGWQGRNGRLYLDCLLWANYLAFDIVGDLAFGAPFGMIQAAKDIAKVPKNQSQEQAMSSYGKASRPEDVAEVPAVKILNGRGEYSMSLGVLPTRWRPFARMIPWYRRGEKDVKTLAGIAIMAVKNRLMFDSDRVDLLAKLKNSKDSNGNYMSREEVTAEALTLLIAGSDTTSNSTCAIIYHLASNPSIQHKLQRELDEQLGPASDDDFALTADQVKSLPYLDACINEGLRIHSTSSLGLPRVIPQGGLTILGTHFPEGTVVSVPSYTIHRDTDTWGEDVEIYRPERFLDSESETDSESKEKQEKIQRCFNPFSLGPRACVGRNLAFLELQMIVGSLMRRYEFVLESDGQVLETREGFLRKPLECVVGVRRRDA